MPRDCRPPESNVNVEARDEAGPSKSHRGGLGSRLLPREFGSLSLARHRKGEPTESELRSVGSESKPSLLERIRVLEVPAAVALKPPERSRPKSLPLEVLVGDPAFAGVEQLTPGESCPGSASTAPTTSPWAESEGLWDSSPPATATKRKGVWGAAGNRSSSLTERVMKSGAAVQRAKLLWPFSSVKEKEREKETDKVKAEDCALQCTTLAPRASRLIPAMFCGANSFEPFKEQFCGVFYPTVDDRSIPNSPLFASVAANGDNRLFEQPRSPSPAPHHRIVRSRSHMDLDSHTFLPQGCAVGVPRGALTPGPECSGQAKKAIFCSTNKAFLDSVATPAW